MSSFGYYYDVRQLKNPSPDVFKEIGDKPDLSPYNFRNWPSDFPEMTIDELRFFAKMTIDELLAF